MALSILITIFIYLIKLVNAYNLTYESGCLEEATNEKMPVIWPYTTELNLKIVSEPLCLTESLELITRVCTENGWMPRLEEVPECTKVTTRSPSIVCGPGFTAIYESGDELIEYCYQTSAPAIWNYPCFNSGSPLTIFDLEEEEFLVLVKSLNLTKYKHTWLPISRIVQFGPLVWTTPGKKWGKTVDIDEFTEHNSLISVSRLSAIQNCLLLDLEKYSVKSENCSFRYPTLCVTREEHLLQLHCPTGYYASLYGLNNGLCYGLELTDQPLTWDEFHNKTCSNPITIKDQNDNYIAKELFSEYNLDTNISCWTGLTKTKNSYSWPSKTPVNYVNWDALAVFDDKNNKGAINARYKWKLYDNQTKLSCMICTIDINDKELGIDIKYVSGYIQLTIYNQQRLWREEDDDLGIRCFSNANGFQSRIFITEEDFYRTQFSLRSLQIETESTEDTIEKIVYRFEPLNDQSGEYWCEGHDSKNFSLITSPTLYIPAQQNDEHMYVLKIIILNMCDVMTACNPNWEDITDSIEDILQVNNVRIMFINNITNTSTILTLHVTVPLLIENCTNVACRIHITYKSFKEHVISEFANTVGSNASNYGYEFLYLKSTLFCLREKQTEQSISWEMTRIGETVAPKELCMQSNGLPVRRKCEGSYVYGAEWGKTMGVCTEDFEPTNRTAFLYSVSKGRVDMATTNSFLVHDLREVLENKEDIIPADIFFLGLSLQMVLHISNINSTAVEIGDSLNIATAIDSIMGIEKNYLNLAQTMNSSNLLLESVDLILSKIALNITDEHFLNQRKDFAITPHFVIQISCPEVNNISGIAIVRPENKTIKSFQDFDFMELTADTSLNDVLNIPNLDAAAWISRQLLDSLRDMNISKNDTSPRVIFEIFYSDVVFQETKKVKDVVNSRVISITIPEYETELTEPVFLVYRKLDKTAINSECAFWDIRSINNGEWSRKGCYYVSSYGDLDICTCFHLTHFAQLVHGFKNSGSKPEDNIIFQYHGKALNAITVVGCSLSLVGVAGIAATAIIFPSWRHKPGSKILLQLSAALAMQSMIMLAQDSVHPSDSHCIALGALLHYSVLAAFVWMLLTALLQFARYVRVLGVQRPVRFMIKFSLLGWGIPIVPVAILLLIDPALYVPPATLISEENPQIPPQRDPSALCYPQGLGLALGCLLPIACIVVTNLIVFVLVMRSITRIPEGVKRPMDPELVLSQLRLSILLFFLLGLSWIFGFLAATSNLILFSYLFCITATLQGFILFVYFIVCDPTTRVLWVSLVREKSISPSKSSVKEISFDTK